ncbi:hypothetical protein ONE63_010327 [Megalurothrips usitatus]|uniref:AB hydrolase-1 domain-containing protein n=1 Tax=Megalurothrips usitatus TaxID=439358 RepID=A0AAV7XM75_9NEOP|nr:hypothetical protein ONE63_010327 [Megalurothrips usitatus]
MATHAFLRPQPPRRVPGAAVAVLGTRGELLPPAVLLLVAIMLPPPASSSTGGAPPASAVLESAALRRLVEGLVATQPVRAARSALELVIKVAARVPSGFIDRLVYGLPPMNDSITSSDLMRALGYPAEGHYVDTEDGFRLRLDRIPNPGRQPVFVAHGLQTSSPAFVLLGKGKALPALLHDAGFDVWMVNYRGTHFSQEHKKYAVNDEEMWKFSFHEHGAYDNPAAIDYVLERTGFASLLYVGHSMGSTSFMTMAATRPEYQSKVRAAFLMAPAGPLRFHRSPVVSMLFAANNITQSTVEELRLYHTMRPMYLFARRLSKITSARTPPSERNALTADLVGFNADADYTSLPYFYDVLPSGGSFGEVFHYVQNANPNMTGFRQYDHGAARNKEVYGSEVPPEYDLSGIDTAIFMYLSHNDILCTPGVSPSQTVPARAVACPIFHLFLKYTRATAESGPTCHKGCGTKSFVRSAFIWGSPIDFAI